MFAVFQSGGKQHRVAEGDVVRLEMLSAEPGEEIVFDKVLYEKERKEAIINTGL